MLAPSIALAPLALPLFASGLAQDAGPAPGPSAAPAIEVTVTHAVSGAPLEGVLVVGGHERDYPVWGETWWRKEARTGRDGVARLPVADPTEPFSRIVMLAEGFGGRMVYTGRGAEPVEMALYPEVPLEIELVHADGRPAPLVHVGVAFGCGHTPDLLGAVSDHRGRLVLHGLAPFGEDNDFDLYPAGFGVRTDYLELPETWREDEVVRVVVANGRTVEGRVIGIDGTPAAGVSVGQPHIHRGPWARTDAEGRFTLHGTDPSRDDLELRAESGEYLGYWAASPRSPAVEIRLTPDQVPAETLHAQPVVVELRADVGAESVGAVEVTLWRPSTGWQTVSSPDADGSCTFEVEPGWYTVFVGADGGPVPETQLGAIEVGALDGPAVLAFDLPPIEVRDIEVVGAGDANRWQFRTAAGEGTMRSFRYSRRSKLRGEDEARSVSYAGSEWLPAAEWTLWVLASTADGSDWRPTRVVSDDGETLRVEVTP